MSKELREAGYSVTAEACGADYPNKGRDLPLGMAFVLRKHGKKINEHAAHEYAWAWAARLEGQFLAA